MKNKTTKRHFKIFCKEVKYWLKRFGLTDWDVELRHGTVAGLEDCAAAYNGDLETRSATIALYPLWGTNLLSDMEVRKSALHEVIHLLLAELSSGAMSRSITTENLDIYEEIIVKRIVNAMFPRNQFYIKHLEPPPGK